MWLTKLIFYVLQMDVGYFIILFLPKWIPLRFSVTLSANVGCICRA